MHTTHCLMGNQAMKFGQLTEYSKTNIFFETSCTKCGAGNDPRTSKKSKLCISWVTSLNIYTVCFYCMPKLRTTKIYRILGADQLLLPHIKLFSGLVLVSLPQLLHNFWRRYISLYILLTNQTLLSDYLHFLRYWV